MDNQKKNVNQFEAKEVKPTAKAVQSIQKDTRSRAHQWIDFIGEIGVEASDTAATAAHHATDIVENSTRVIGEGFRLIVNGGKGFIDGLKGKKKSSHSNTDLAL